MNTNRTTRFAGLLLAVLMTVAVNGAMLWKFDAIAQEGVIANGGQMSTVVILDTVNIVAQRS